jgi:hypothetical protein
VCALLQAFCWLCGQATGREHTWTTIAGHSCGAYKDDADKRADEAQRCVFPAFSSPSLLSSWLIALSYVSPLLLWHLAVRQGWDGWREAAGMGRLELQALHPRFTVGMSSSLRQW